MNPSIQIVSNTNYPVGKIINQELQNSLETQIAVAFLKQSGVKTIENSLMMSLEKGGKFELIVGLDFKTTDPIAMKFFIDLHRQNKEVKFYCYGDKSNSKNDIVFHPKIYLFRNARESVSIIGSTNLTQGGLMTNFEVNTVFNEKKPVYYSQLQAIYNYVKYTDSLFTPDEEYLCQYSDVFKAISENEEKAKKDSSIKKMIKEMSDKETKLPGTIPSVNAMIIEFLKEQMSKGIQYVSLNEIYINLDEKIKDPVFEGHFRLETFHNTIRGELNKHHEDSAYSTSLKLYKRGDKGMYSLTDRGANYNGR